MKRAILFFGLSLIFFTKLIAQDLRANLFIGTANYSGDLQARPLTFQQSRFAIGGGISYGIHPKLMVRGGLTYMQLQASDRYQTAPLNRQRNLSFQTNLWELHAAGEYHFLGMYERVFSPYILAGVAAFHFNPYAYAVTGDKVFLKPLSTEGQGLAAYPGRKPYKLTQFAIPIGIGVRMALTEKFDVGAEISYRKSFTDYIDDVSTTYVNPANFTNPLSLPMSYRTPELSGHSTDPYPAEFQVRGGSKHKDNYYTIGITITYHILGTNETISHSSGKSKSRLSCPTNVF